MTLTIRNFRWEDMAAVVEVMNLAAPRAKPLRVEEIEPHWRAPYNHPERDCFVALADGRLVGAGIADLLDTPNEANGVMWVLPDQQEAARSLLDTTDDYFLQTALKNSPPDAPIQIYRSVSESATETIAMLEAEGYQLARRFYTMRIHLDQPILPAAVPAGFHVRPILVHAEARPVYEAQQVAFRDHWGSSQVQPFEEWLYPTTQPNFDPALWQVALIGDQVAGMALGELRSAEYGWIGIVGVVPQWRKQGLALALLTRCLAAFRERGVSRVELGVDTENADRAVVLYERAGMHIANCRPTYRKVLHAGG